jgi:hypothetical protein
MATMCAYRTHPLPSKQHLSDEYSAAVARCTNEFRPSTSSQLQSLLDDTQLNVVRALFSFFMGC